MTASSFTIVTSTGRDPVVVLDPTTAALFEKYTERVIAEFPGDYIQKELA